MLEVEVLSRYDDIGVELRIYERKDDGTVYLAAVNEQGELEFNKHEKGRKIKPTLVLQNISILQKIFDSAVMVKIISIPDKTKEIETHLQDIRTLLGIIQALSVKKSD